MPPFMFEMGLGFGFRERVGGGAVDLGGFVNDIEDGGLELRWVFAADVEWELGVWEMGWDFWVSEVGGVGLGRSFFWNGIEDVEEERVCPWLVRDVALAVVLVGVLVAVEPVFVTTVVALEP